jgi:hypothetical protein
MEIWKPIPGYEGQYEVSDQGRVKNSCGKVLTLCNVSGGYKAVSLGRNNSKIIHRLVAKTFLGTPPQGKNLVLHGDRDRANNCIGNLRYGSHLDNSNDAKMHGTRVQGERQHAAKLTEQDVLFIRTSTLSVPALAQKYSVTRQCIHLVQKRKNWGHV